MIRVAVIDGSASATQALRQLLEVDGDIAVVHQQSSLREAAIAIRNTEAQLLLISAGVLSAGGLASITYIMAEAPLPIVVLADLLDAASDELLGQALLRGALSVYREPVFTGSGASAALRVAVRHLVKVPVVRHLRRRSRPDIPLLPAFRNASLRQSPIGLSLHPEVIGIGASAGGPAALAEILGGLPPDFPGSILVVQHLPSGFAQPFADYLRAHILLPVVVAKPLLDVVPGQVILAPDGAHLLLTEKRRVGLSHAPMVSGHRPSVDILFESLSQWYGAKTVGIVLSGIGQDGTAGLLHIRKAGGTTIAQAGESAAVNGMPRSARDSGAAQQSLAPTAIAQLLRDLFCTSTARSADGG